MFNGCQDVERTKADMEYFRQPNVRDKMEMMLTCWCKMERTKYKQGLNEATSASERAESGVFAGCQPLFLDPP